MTAPSPVRSILVDTNCFIYLFEVADSPVGRYVERVFREAATGRCALVTSTVCLSEFLVGLARRGGSPVLTRAMTAFVSLPGLAVVPVTNEVATSAASLRGSSSLRLFDAMVIATGLVEGVDEFLTNDATLVRGSHGLHTVYLEDVAT
jgi:predicted nucleic acid-binding protein